MYVGELGQSQVLSDHHGAQYCRRGRELLPGLDINDLGSVRDEDVGVAGVSLSGEVPGDWAGSGQYQGEGAPVGRSCYVEEDVLRRLVQSDDVHLLLLRVGGRPAAARGGADPLVEGREVGSVERVITVTGQARGEASEPQQDVIGYDHEDFHC